ncbi:TonB-dependent receptor [Arcobacter sp. FW59]|nr:TonB-dependent receptor [Arcobacter sp. FW59]
MNLSLKETPQSVSVITSKRMEDQQLNNLTDVMNNTIGIHAKGISDGSGQAEFWSRGYVIQNYQIDGAPTTYFTSYGSSKENIDTALYDSVSVVRGATGLLTGAGDPSGSVNLIRKKPSKEFQASLEAQAGRWDKYRGVVDIGGGFNNDESIRGRFIAVNDQGGHFHQLSDKERSTLYGIVEADLGDSTTISGSWERAYIKNNGDAYLGGATSRFFSDTSTLTPYDKNTWNIADWTKHEQTRDNFTLALNHHINDSWKIATTYSYLQDDVKRKQSACWNLKSDGSCSYGATGNSRFDHEGHTLDVKLNGQFDLWGQTHDLVLGFNGQKIKTTSFSRDIKNFDNEYKFINNKLIISEPNWDIEELDSQNNNTQYGTYISTRLKLTDKLSTILGGRYSKYDDDYETREEKINVNKDNFSPYIALSYDFTDNLTTYASYTEIFNQNLSAKDSDGKYLEPETGFNYEIGLKGEWFDGKLNTSIALFQSGKDNLAVLQRDSNGNIVRRSDGEIVYKAEDNTKNKGWEFEIVGNINPNWQVQAGFSESILRNSKDKIINEGVRPLRTAKMFTIYQATSELTLGGGLRWQSETWNDGVKNNYIRADHPEMVGEATQKDYYVVDLMANYEFNKNLSLLVNINNVLNKEYKTSFTTYSYGEERNWMATLKYKF